MKVYIRSLGRGCSTADWREFAGYIGEGLNEPFLIRLEDDAGEEAAIAVARKTSEWDFRSFMEAVEASGHIDERVRKAEAACSLSGRLSFASRGDGGSWTFPAIQKLFGKYPRLAPGGDYFSPLLFADFDFQERNGFLFLTSRATAGGLPILQARLLPAVTNASTDILPAAYRILDDPERKDPWGPWKALMVFSTAMSEACDRHIEELSMPKEASRGVNFEDAAKFLKEKGCLLRYSGDFFWNDRETIMRSGGKKRMVFLFRESGSWSLENTDPGTVARFAENARFGMILDPDGNGRYSVRIEELPKDRKKFAKRMEKLLPARPKPVIERDFLSSGAPVTIVSNLRLGIEPKRIPLAGDSENTVEAVFEYEGGRWKWKLEESAGAFAWTDVRHPEIPCMPMRRPAPSMSAG